MELFIGGLALLFIALKLLGKLDWPWLWVLAIAVVAGFLYGVV